MSRDRPRVCISTIGAPCLATTAAKIGLVSQPADVVDQRGARRRAPRRRSRPCRYRRRSGPARGRQRFDDRQHPAALLTFRRRLRAGPGGLAADVQQICAVVHHPHAGVDRRLGIQQLPAVGERIGRHVDDAHHQRPLAERQRPAAAQRNRESAAGIHGTETYQVKRQMSKVKASKGLHEGQRQVWSVTTTHRLCT